MKRDGQAWIPDGRAKSILAGCEASLSALDGLPIDLFLLHAPDTRTPWRTQVRALARLVDDGLVRSVGVCNVNRTQLDEALDLAPISAVQVALSVFDDRALRGGIVERCEDRDLMLMAHSPLGGPKRSGRLDRHDILAPIAQAHSVPGAEVALAWLLQLSPRIVPIPGATRAETARSAAHAASLELTETELGTLANAFGSRRSMGSTVRRVRPAGAEVVVVMGIPGAGKTRFAADHVARGHTRLNRDERGGSLRDLNDELEEALRSDPRAVVLDNTYLTRASRSHVIESAHRHGRAARCVFLDTPLAHAQVNLVWRLLERFDGLPSPDDMRERAKVEEGIVTPTSQMRTLRELEPPTLDEGWDAIDVVPFARAPWEPGAEAVFVAASVLEADGWQHTIETCAPTAPHLVFGWTPDSASDAIDAAATKLATEVGGRVTTATCGHESGPPRCWCRPPLPGLILAFAREHRIDIGHSTLIGTRPQHATLAEALGCRYAGA
jgi:diketogulonate reductase-like aldo/keto reductase/adenylate kinase family enzyme